MLNVRLRIRPAGAAAPLFRPERRKKLRAPGEKAPRLAGDRTGFPVRAAAPACRIRVCEAVIGA
ncbi:MAG: hypothetical protein J6C30_03320 [Lentisphaeria bacterium]|nr:hypothetical protein [Lentisphaeria bacterium]